MKIHADKVRENKTKAAGDHLPGEQSHSEPTLAFTDNRPGSVAQRALQETANNGQQVKQLKSYQAMADKSPQAQQAAQLYAMAGQFAAQNQYPIQRKESKAGIPAPLKSGMEHLSGMDMSDVTVHYNSDKPAELQALAYAQGTDVHLGPDQEKLLAHEIWHVVQQKQGRVKPTMRLDGGVGVNDDHQMEQEASEMGKKAISWGTAHKAVSEPVQPAAPVSEAPVQRFVTIDQGALNYPAKKEHRSVKKDKNVPNDTSFFVSQDLTNVDGGYVDGPNGLEANLVYKSNADLMVSDALDLAIEADVEAKYFFATKSRIKEANAQLKGNVRLKTTSRYLKITSGNKSKKLFQVQPYVPAKLSTSAQKGGTGLGMRIPQRCNEMSEFVTGKPGVESTAGRQVFVILSKVLTGLPTIDRDFRQEFTEVLKNIGTVEGNQAYMRLTEEMSQAYKDALDNGLEASINRHLSILRVNKFMDPSIGSSITTYGVGTDDEISHSNKATTFGYHFAAVVAKSGSDYISLENYARRNEKSKDMLSAGDPLFFFRMYGTNSDTDNWHQKAMDTNAFVGRAISFVVE